MKHLKLFLLLKYVQTSLCAFSSGKIKEGIYEYSDMNGWMHPKAAAALCESDLKCGGFTFHGVLTELQEAEYEVYFFHYVNQIHLGPWSTALYWDWTTYTVNRDYILLPGYFYGDSSEMEYLPNPPNILQNPEEASKLCMKTDNCAGITQSEGRGTFILENFYFYHKMENWTEWNTIVPLSTKTNQVHDWDYGNIDKCCPGIPLEQVNISGEQIPMEVKNEDCTISKDDFIRKYVRKRIPVVLKNCLDPSLFTDPRQKELRFGGKNFDDILEMLFNRGNSTTTAVSRPLLRRKLIEIMKQTEFKIDYKQAEQLAWESENSEESLTLAPSFTHTKTPNDAHFTYSDVLEMKAEGRVRVFLKLSNIKSRLDCYKQYRIKGTDKLRKGHEKCLVLDGLWKPPPMPDDLYGITKYDNDLAWIIMSAENTGSQLHKDPDLMGAWNILLTGRKWWAVLPFRGQIHDYNCNNDCSPGWDDGSNAFPWFKHILPQLRERKLYGKNVLEFVQLPGDVLYLPYEMPHTIFNIDDNVALTENFLFPDSLPHLVKAITANEIKRYVPNFNETAAFRTLYNGHADRLDRQKMRDTYSHISKLASRFSRACTQE